ncbi:hypothetical protein BVC80_537g1 [Macleaya cordata]|uniref:Uncharacterized protein n=1 Tax=Macleaya cordata TaxID=56857 RepID=A0A200PMT9_MACCD|nr:hypothetical protein BVC80_537g1 [Macleaya cordata]
MMSGGFHRTRRATPLQLTSPTGESIDYWPLEHRHWSSSQKNVKFVGFLEQRIGIATPTKFRWSA